jgi:hypothetical protein
MSGKNELVFLRPSSASTRKQTLKNNNRKSEKLRDKSVCIVGKPDILLHIDSLFSPPNRLFARNLRLRAPPSLLYKGNLLT